MDLQKSHFSCDLYILTYIDSGALVGLCFLGFNPQLQTCGAHTLPAVSPCWYLTIYAANLVHSGKFLFLMQVF